MEVHHQYEIVAAAIRWIHANQHNQPSLEELSAHLSYSPSHLQKTFQAWAGVSPKQFLKFLTKKQAIDRLGRGERVLEASLSCGLSSPGRIHDLVVTTTAMSPGDVRRRAEGVQVTYGFGPTPFGTALVAFTKRGICFLGFCDENSQADVLQQLNSQWPLASLVENRLQAEENLDHIFKETREKPIKVWLHGSPFQLKVWEALLHIPQDTSLSYGDIAKWLGQSSASRAVGGAVGKNPVAWLIPCHRVITSLGTLGGYRWGQITKQAMIGYEAATARRQASEHQPL
jgi:AraC family transcriptional regulator of adaptative response/methylated-DNA-[protein]-cysteine methyltransferase